MTIKEKLSSLLIKKFNWDNLFNGIDLQRVGGRRDSGEFSWFSTNTNPTIVSNLTMTECLKAKELFYYIDEHHQIEISDEDMSNSTFFPNTKVNPEINIKYNSN